MELQVFNSTEFGSVRTATVNGEVMFVAKDIATILGYSNPRDAINKHVDDEDKGVAKCDTPGGTQNLVMINESGLYSLILSSKMPNAKKFKHWVSRIYDPLQGDTGLSNKGYDIAFDHVGFAYNGGETVLKDVSFTAKQGEVTALVGPSGGGKTTVSRLAARFWDVSRGKITVGGMDISKIDPEALLSLFSIVFQDVTLFDNTILENIRIGNKEATDEQVLAAAKLANVDEFAKKLPDGWHTNIGENGCELSGGERQRISIARAFLKDSPIILLDEATASLDVENETLIQTALSRLIADKTVLVIAHRMRTVAGADKIVVLSEGSVAEEGASEELLKQNGLYAHMVNLQTESQNWKLA